MQDFFNFYVTIKIYFQIFYVSCVILKDEIVNDIAMKKKVIILIQII